MKNSEIKDYFIDSNLIKQYLLANLWTIKDHDFFWEFSPSLELLKKTPRSKDYHLFVPKEITYRGGLISQILLLWERMSYVYECPMEDLLWSIKNINQGKRLISLRLKEPATENGTIPYYRLMDLLGSTKDILKKAVEAITSQRFLDMSKKDASDYNFLNNSEILGIEKGSFILKMLVPINSVGTSIFKMPIETEESLQLVERNIEFINNHIIPAPDKEITQDFYDEHNSNFNTGVLQQSINIIKKFPHSLIEIYPYEKPDDPLLKIAPQEITKTGIKQLSKAINQIIDIEKESLQEVEGKLYEFEDTTVLNANSKHVKIKLKTEAGQKYTVPYITLDETDKIHTALKNKQKIHIKGIVRDNQIVEVKTFSLLPK